MTIDAASSQPPTEIFKALADPVRWDIIMQMASVDELACMTLEDTLPVSKPTISYHTKILYHAGLITVRKSGRNYYYSLRRDVLRSLLFDLWVLAPTSQAAEPDDDVRVAMGRLRQRGTGYALAEPARKGRAARASRSQTAASQAAAPQAVRSQASRSQAAASQAVRSQASRSQASRAREELEKAAPSPVS